MESKNSVNGGTLDVEGRGKEVKMVNKSATVRCSDLVLRVVALVLTMVAAIVVGIDKQTTVVSVPVVSTLPPVNVPVTAKWHYMSAFVYFVVTNAIACAYAALSLVLTLATRGEKKGLALMIIVLDLVMVALLFSGNGAANAMGVVGYQGNSHVGWNKVCNVVEKFCHQFIAAVALSLLGSLAFLLLIVVAAFDLHKKNM